MIMVKEVHTNHRFGEKPYLGFEHVTMVPYCRKLIETKLLTMKERHWLNAYHEDILSKIRGFFEKGSLAMDWLERECKPY